MRTSTRWTLAVLAVLGALILGLVLELSDGPAQPGSAPDSRTRRDADTAESLVGPRQLADLPPCPVDGSGAGPVQLRGVVAECAANGTEVDLARVVAGRTVVLNLWAYWCGPCAEELPAMQAYQHRVKDSVTVLAVHQDENEAAGLLRMAELGVRLPVLQDGGRRVAAALGVPNVMPATVVLRADGSVAAVLLQPFTSADQIDAAVQAALR